MKVAITGTLAMPRKDAVHLIESRTGATFSEHVTYDTNYLIAARFDTNKARRAASIGVSVISEADMMRYVEQGAFPPNRLPDRPKHPHVSHFPDIIWNELFEPEIVALMKYRDANGLESERFVTLTCKGEGSNNVEYIGGYDAECFKTFRKERIVSLEEIAKGAAAGA